MKHELTDRFLKSLKPPERGRIEVSDIKRPGLRFRLSESGRAVWMYEKRIKGGPKRKHTLGVWPEPVSLSQARAMALELEAEAAKGVDRVAEETARKQADEAAKASLLTVKEVIDLYDRLHLSGLRSGVERRRQLEQSLSVHLNVSIASLTRQNLQAAIDAKASAGRKPYANRIRMALMAFTNWAWKRNYISHPIAAGLTKATNEVARERVLSLAEIRQIWQATNGLGDFWGPPFRLVFLTCQRRGEILGLRWDEVDLEKARIVKPGSRTKNGKAHTTHLSAPALKEMERLARKVESKSGFVFTTTGKTPVSGISKVKARLDKLLGDDFEPWRIHDIRTAFATAMADANIPEAVADRVLNHSATGSAPSAVARVYNQSELLPQRAAALDRWARLILDSQDNIIRIGKNHV